jgi:hypothetical protein
VAFGHYAASAVAGEWHGTIISIEESALTDLTNPYRGYGVGSAVGCGRATVVGAAFLGRFVAGLVRGNVGTTVAN